MQRGMALKKGEWKLVHHGNTPDEGTDELYHISIDPNEKENVAKENEELLLELKRELKHQFSLDSPVLAKEIQ